MCLEDEFPFDSLVNIDGLHLDNTNMKTVPGEIGQMVKIKYSTLQRNKLKPREFCNLPSDARAYLYHNPLSSPPI